MPREISGLRIARSFISPAGQTEVSRVIDFQLGARQGIQIHSVLGSILPEAGATTISTSSLTINNGSHTLHAESGSLEAVPDAGAEDEDTIDSEIFYRQDLAFVANDDTTTEFRSAIALSVTPSGVVEYRRPLFLARNPTHRGVNSQAALSTISSVTIYYTFVEFSLSELGLILARRT